MGRNSSVHFSTIYKHSLIIWTLKLSIVIRGGAKLYGTQRKKLSIINCQLSILTRGAAKLYGTQRKKFKFIIDFRLLRPNDRDGVVNAFQFFCFLALLHRKANKKKYKLDSVLGI